MNSGAQCSSNVGAQSLDGARPGDTARESGRVTKNGIVR